MSQSFQVAKASSIVVVLDDDLAVRDSLKFMLEIGEFDVRLYPSGGELLRERELPAASCLIVDYRMPEMNGLDLIARLRDRGLSAPAILITTHPSEGLRNRATAAGIPIVEKPLLDSTLLDAVRAAIDGDQQA
jgi:FixJ family two-component response regulator